MAFEGKVKFIYQRIALIIITLLSLIIYNLLVLFNQMSLSLWVPSLICGLFIIFGLELMVAEKISNASIMDRKVSVEKAYVFGIVKVKRGFDLTDEFDDYIDYLFKEDIATFTIPPLDNINHCNIIFSVETHALQDYKGVD